VIVTACLLLAVGAPLDGALTDRDLAYQAALAGDLAEAEALYEGLIARGFDGADLHYNLGTVELEQGDWAAAVGHLRSALRRDPGHAAARHNLAVARHRAGTEVEDVEPRLLDALRPLYGGLGFLTWLGLFAGANLTAAIAAGSRSQGWRRLGLGMATVLGVPSALALVALHFVFHEPWAIVTEPTRLRDGPAERFSGPTTLPPATDLRVTGQQGAYLRVRTRDGKTGYVDQAALRRPD
jgi:hypothetical protein